MKNIFSVISEATKGSKTSAGILGFVGIFIANVIVFVLMAFVISEYINIRPLSLVFLGGRYSLYLLYLTIFGPYLVIPIVFLLTIRKSRPLFVFGAILGATIFLFLYYFLLVYTASGFAP